MEWRVVGEGLGGREEEGKEMEEKEGVVNRVNGREGERSDRMVRVRIPIGELVVIILWSFRLLFLILFSTEN